MIDVDAVEMFCLFYRGQNVPLCENRPDLPRATFDSKQAIDVRPVVSIKCAPKLFVANDSCTSLVPLGAVQKRNMLESSGVYFILFPCANLSSESHP